MKAREDEIQDHIRNHLTTWPGLRLFRANLMGQAWQGKVLRSSVGEVILGGARKIESGLPSGWPDTFGFIKGPPPRPVFIEVKKPGENPTPQQVAFLRVVHADGCLAGVARSIEDAEKIMRGEFLL